MWQKKSIFLFLCTAACFNKIRNNQDPELPPWCSSSSSSGLCLWPDAQQPSHAGDILRGEATNSHTREPSPFTWCQTLLPAFSYQKKILERRLAEADGLSFASFRTGSMLPNSNSKLPETFSAGSVAEGYRSTLGVDKKNQLKDGCCGLQEPSASHSTASRGLLAETPVWESGERSAAWPRPPAGDWLTEVFITSSLLFFLIQKYKYNLPTSIVWTSAYTCEQKRIWKSMSATVGNEGEPCQINDLVSQNIQKVFKK